METKITILGKFFETPEKSYGIRELSRILKINHTTIRQYLSKLVKVGLLSIDKSYFYPAYKLVASRESLNLKLYYNLEKLRKSGLIDFLEKEFDFPVIILFGSYAKARDNETSDIDLCVISNIEKKINPERYKLSLNREVSIHHFTKKGFESLKNKNRELFNNICNGIVISGQLEAI